MNVTKLPTAAESYYAIRQRGGQWQGILVTPMRPKPLITVLVRSASREAIEAHLIAAGAKTQRPVKGIGHG